MGLFASTGQTGWGQGEGRSDPAAPGRASSRRERAKQAKRGAGSAFPSASHLCPLTSHMLSHTHSHHTAPTVQATRLRTQAGPHPLTATNPGMPFLLVVCTSAQEQDNLILQRPRITVDKVCKGRRRAADSAQGDR